MNELNLTQSLADLVEIQMLRAGTGSFEQAVDVVKEIVDNEVERYRLTLERGSRIVQRLATSYKKKAIPIPVRELMTLYDSHGIPPEIVQEIAANEQENVELPDNFYSMIVGLHSQGVAEEQNPLSKYQEKIRCDLRAQGIS
jgi:alanyl-tRNA synthetase